MTPDLSQSGSVFNVDFYASDVDGFDSNTVVVIVEAIGAPAVGSVTAMINEVEFDGALVPEPSAVALLALGGLAFLRRRRG